MFVDLLHTIPSDAPATDRTFYKIGTFGGCACRVMLSKAKRRKKGRKIVGSPDYLAWLDSSAPTTAAKIKSFLRREAVRMVEEISAQITFGKLAKALTPAEIKRIIDSLDFSRWVNLIGIIEPDFLEAFQINARAGWEVIGFSPTEEIVELVNDQAVEWARRRSADLVGMRYTDNGDLVENPNPRYSITETTREELRAMTADAVQEGLSSQDFADDVQSSFAFSEQRAMMVARTELAFAHVEGNMAAWAESGLVVGTQWILGSEHDMDDECNENAEAGIVALGDEFPSGDTGPPAHPNCVCDVIPILSEE